MIEVGEVSMVDISQIEVDERARKEFGDLTELTESLKASGLIQPLSVVRTDKGYKLLAGERRLTVLRNSGNDVVPVRIYSQSISKVQQKEIELAENLYRKDFEYWEHDNLIREIHKLQEAKKGKSAPGPGNTGAKMDDTAQILGVSKAAVSTAIKRAEVREMFPDLFIYIRHYFLF